MPRKLAGIRRMRNGWQAYIRVDKKLYSKMYAIDTAIATMRAWREDTKGKHATPTESGSFAADVVAYLAIPDVAAEAGIKDKRAHLNLWATELGRDRARATITRDEVEAVLQRWLRQFAEATVYHRRSSLLSLYTRLDGPGAANVVKLTTKPKAWTMLDHSVPFALLNQIVDAMGDDRRMGKGIRQPAVGKLVARVLIAVGMRPEDLRRVRRTDVDFEAGTVRWPASDKGTGRAAVTLPLTAEGIAAFRAFDAAKVWGAFKPQVVSHSFKRAARRVDGKDTPIHLYSLRHGVGADVYRATGDLATVGRLLGHKPGSRCTAQYAQGANAEVDRAAVAKLTAARSAAVAAAASVQNPSTELHGKLRAPRKSRVLKHIRRAS